jgi:hypothetical protein
MVMYIVLHFTDFALPMKKRMEDKESVQWTVSTKDQARVLITPIIRIYHFE